MKTYYFNWFKNVMNFFIFLFFPLAVLSNLYVYTSIFSGNIKWMVFGVLIVLYLIVVLLFKEKIRWLLEYLLNAFKKLSMGKMLLIIIGTSLFMKGIGYLFFFFDSTLGGGDITVYSNVAEKIVSGGYESVSEVIYYIVGMGSHLALFKMIHLPIHVGIYLVFILATSLNFYAFSEVVGKEKSFMMVMLYMLMPSTALLTFCATHELFVYFYFSIIFFLFNRFFKSDKYPLTLLYGLLLMVFVVLNQTVSPIGKIWFIVMAIFLLLCRIGSQKKLIIVLILIVGMVVPNFMSTGLEDNYLSQLNNVEQLLIGADIESGGHHTDGRGIKAAREYYEKLGLEVNYDNLLEAEIGALKDTYIFLFTHPDKLLGLLANKFYTAWSGDFYSVELGHSFGGYGDIPFYIMLIISGAWWLVALSIGTVFYNKKDEGMDILNYKLVLLGVVAVLLIVEIANKYSCYMTIFIYLISIARSDLLGGSENEEA